MATPTDTTSAALSSKRVVYVGGIPDDATEDLIRAAFVPFGNISNVYLVRSLFIAHNRCTT